MFTIEIFCDDISRSIFLNNLKIHWVFEVIIFLKTTDYLGNITISSWRGELRITEWPSSLIRNTSLLLITVDGLEATRISSLPTSLWLKHVRRGLLALSHTLNIGQLYFTLQQWSYPKRSHLKGVFILEKPTGTNL